MSKRVIDLRSQVPLLDIVSYARGPGPLTPVTSVTRRILPKPPIAVPRPCYRGAGARRCNRSRSPAIPMFPQRRLAVATKEVDCTKSLAPFGVTRRQVRIYLYFRYKSEGKVHSVYVPAELREAVRDAQNAWQEFQQIDSQISADNRERLLSSLECDKQLVRAKRSR
jgi:hypothetical protein